MQKTILLSCLLINSLLFCADEPEIHHNNVCSDVNLSLYKTCSHNRLQHDALSNSNALATFIEYAKEKISPEDQKILICIFEKAKIALGNETDRIDQHLCHIENLFNQQLKIHHFARPYIETVEAIEKQENHSQKEQLSLIQYEGTQMYRNSLIQGLSRAQHILNQPLSELELSRFDLKEVPADHYTRIAETMIGICISKRNELKYLLYNRLTEDMHRHNQQMILFAQHAGAYGSLETKRDLTLQFETIPSEDQIIEHALLLRQLFISRLRLYPSCQRYIQEFEQRTQQDTSIMADRQWNIIHEEITGHLYTYLSGGLMQARHILYQSAIASLQLEQEQLRTAEEVALSKFSEQCAIS